MMKKDLSKRLEDAANEEPKPPLNAYFKTRQMKMRQYSKEGVTEGTNNKFKAFWAALPEIEKQELEDQYKKAKDKHSKDYDKWIAKHGLSEDDLKEIKASRNPKKNRSKSKSKRSKSKMSLTKKERSKSRDKDGRKRRAFENKSKDKKKEESRSKSRSKSKDKGKNKNTSRSNSKKKK